MKKLGDILSSLNLKNYRPNKKKILIATAVVIVLAVVGSIFVITKQKTGKDNGVQAKVDVNNRGPQKTDQKDGKKATQQSQAKESKSNSPACIAAKNNSTKLFESYRNENKRHAQKLKELEEYWRANGGVEQEGYKQQVSAEGELYQKNLNSLNSALSKKNDC